MGIFTSLAQGEVVRTEPSRKVASVVGVFAMAVALAGIVALQARRVNGPAQPGLAMSAAVMTALTWFATGLLLLGFVSALVNGRRWLLARDIERISNSEVGRVLQPETDWIVHPMRASAIPDLSIEPCSTRRQDRPRHLRRVTSTHNVTGQPLLRIAYLRIFDNQPRARTFMQSAWREFGYVYMLRSASSVSPREYRALRRDGVGLTFVRSRAALEQALAGEARPDRPGRRVFRNLAPTTVRTRDRYGGYPPVTMLCHGSFWRDAVDEVLLRVDAVCMDLSGFTDKHNGTGYELQRVVDRFPIERVVFLMDPKSKERFLRSAIVAAWDQMAAGSPNEGHHGRRTHLVRTDHVRTTITVNDRGQETNRQSRLVAQRPQTGIRR